MSAQPSLDDYLDAEREKRHGLALAGTGDRHWNEGADRAIAHLAALGHHFTADAVRDLAGPPDHPSAMGAALNRAARARLIVAVGFETSKRASRHCGLLGLAGPMSLPLTICWSCHRSFRPKRPRLTCSRRCSKGWAKYADPLFPRARARGWRPGQGQVFDRFAEPWKGNHTRTQRGER